MPGTLFAVPFPGVAARPCWVSHGSRGQRVRSRSSAA